MNNKLLVINEQGKEVEAEILLYYKSKKNSKDYILYTYHELDDQSMETIHASVLVKAEEGFKLEKISDDEWLEVKDIMREIIKNEEGR